MNRVNEHTNALTLPSPIKWERVAERPGEGNSLAASRLCAFALTAFLLLVPALQGQPTWQVEFAKMPLIERVSELDRHNCVRIMENSFQRNGAVQALVFMPGATDEFYFFRRAKARLTNAAPTLLDAVVALTNQTYVRATVVPPFLLLHTSEDPLDLLITIEDQHTADRIKRRHFEKHVVYNDPDWDFVQPILAYYVNTHISPPAHTRDTDHFFRHSFAAFDLNGWDALRAVALADKTKFTVKKGRIVFEGDSRSLGKPPNVDGFLLKDIGEVK